MAPETAVLLTNLQLFQQDWASMKKQLISRIMITIIITVIIMMMTTIKNDTSNCFAAFNQCHAVHHSQVLPHYTHTPNSLLRSGHSMATIEETTGAYLELEHEDSLEDFSDVSKGDTGLLGVQVLWEELQPELEDSGSAKDHLLRRHCYVFLYPQTLQHLNTQRLDANLDEN